MSAVAILVGISAYNQMNSLPCCRTDVDAIAALTEATGRFEFIHKLIDIDASDLKHSLRAALEHIKVAQEIFFYFSGHGFSDEDDFYFCPKDFNHRRPNETGLSNTELTALLRESSPELAVKVIDACSSGTLLIKSNGNFLPADKGGLKNLVQIASCLESQTSLAGDPLSEFTEKFCRAAVRATDGPVYYTDIISILRDDYLQDQDRSPHFVFQASARETLVEDAARLIEFRDLFEEAWGSQGTSVQSHEPALAVPATVEAPSLIELLTQTDAKLAKPDQVSALVDALFDGLKARLSEDAFSDFFELIVVEHTDFNEATTRGFIIRVLNQEKRQDEFVTATITRERKRHGPFSSIAATMALGLYGGDEFTENWDLSLNMRMDRAQLRITLTPKFSTLQRMTLVVSCAPSLERCYVFELATRHPRTDWNAFAEEGMEITRRWYKIDWGKPVGWLVESIAEKLEGAVKDHLNLVAERVAKD